LFSCSIAGPAAISVSISTGSRIGQDNPRLKLAGPVMNTPPMIEIFFARGKLEIVLDPTCRSAFSEPVLTSSSSRATGVSERFFLVFWRIAPGSSAWKFGPVRFFVHI